MAHGIARFSPKYCSDGMRFWSIGRSEAKWWTVNVLKKSEADLVKRLLPLGFDGETCRDLANPGFVDPFHVDNDVSLHSHRGWYYGKLDWMLFRNLRVVRKDLGNHRYQSSDHKWLMCEFLDEPPISDLTDVHSCLSSIHLGFAFFFVATLLCAILIQYWSQDDFPCLE
eukprot:TRINITY_DN15395_c0_g1_i1.p1 TRINITY_DN15395_c0_g1~~TRINITY_DN15395_c0_g1_i1.p1  ORF type:complete len:169 (-),score=14.77 TRINITY_DN15395_c0_g1_i1:50-556(-)